MRGVNSMMVMSVFGIGIAAGALAWLSFGSMLGAPALGELDLPEAALLGQGGQRQEQIDLPPLFSGQNADPSVRLTGISRTGGRAAALLSVGSTPPQWMSRGETAHGLTLVEIGSSQILIETGAGRRTVSLGETSDPEPNAGVGGPGMEGLREVAQDDFPPGMRASLPPADAP